MSDAKIPSQYAKLSLRARLAIALSCLEQYIRKYNIESGELTQFINHMWEIPCMSHFPAWGSTAPSLLRCVGLGDPIEGEFKGLSSYLCQIGVSTEEVAKLIQLTTEIIYSSAYGASDDTGSLDFLKNLIAISERHGIRPPTATLFAESKFSDNHGWSYAVSVETRNAWRNVAALP